MKLQAVMEKAKNYKLIVTILARHLQGYEKESSEDFEKVRALLEIQKLEVSSVSKFSDEQWYFPEAREKRAKTLGISRFRIRFGSYRNIPESIIFQIKLVTLIVTLLPRAEVARGFRGARGKPVQIQSLVPMMRSWLSYIDHVFCGLYHEFGDDVVRENFQSLEDLKKAHYVKYSEGYKTTRGMAQQIERSFSLFQAKRIRELLFEDHLFFPKLHQTKAKVSESKLDDREKVLSDVVFEKITAISGYIVVDFLGKLGIKINDEQSVDLMRHFPFKIRSHLINIDCTIVDTYTLIRMRDKGYPYTYSVTSIGYSHILTDNQDSCSIRKVLKRYINRDGNNIDSLEEVRKYLDLVYRSAVYIIAQFTGMRPSELIEVRVDREVENSFGIPCIVSTLRKHKGTERALFDDKWVCTPAMLDALEALRVIAKIRANPYLLSKSETVPYKMEPTPLAENGLGYVLRKFFANIVPGEIEESDVFPYMLRHTLAYQLFKIDLGLPYISHQLKHFGNLVGAYSAAANKGFSETTLEYGDIGEKLSGSTKRRTNLRHQAEIQAVKSSYDPDATYAGVNAGDHTQRMKRIFQGYMAEGYTKDDIFEAMAEQGVAIANVGTGMCYGGKAEDFDDSIPCIGGLRCNPVRCKNAVVTKANIPKWREVYFDNLKIVELGEDSPSYQQAVEAVKEAQLVLDTLGEEV